MISDPCLSNIYMNNLLLSYRWKFAGLVTALAGIVFAITYLFFDFTFKIPVFAVYSSFLETNYFTSFSTNFSEELILLLLLCGFGLIIFSKEKKESECLDAIRLKSMARACIANMIFLLFSVLFVYGSGFIAILVINLFSFFILYLLFFYLRKREKAE